MYRVKRLDYVQARLSGLVERSLEPSVGWLISAVTSPRVRGSLTQHASSLGERASCTTVRTVSNARLRKAVKASPASKEQRVWPREKDSMRDPTRMPNAHSCCLLCVSSLGYPKSTKLAARSYVGCLLLLLITLGAALEHP